jgi:fibronectin type 3 domain-containing protein
VSQSREHTKPVPAPGPRGSKPASTTRGSARARARALAGVAAAAALAFAGLTAAAAPSAAFAATSPAVAIPPTPANEELTANSDSSITMSWSASPGATSYNIYRSTTSGAEGTTPYATTTATSYRDTGLSSTPIYFYQVSAVDSAGESARTTEDASKTPPPIGTGGNVPGVASGAGEVYYAKNALLGGFDWFQTLTGWYPQVLGSSGSITPGNLVVDMAYSEDGTLTFNDVVVPTSGLYTVDWRYAFQSGLFPGINNRQMGLEVDGTVITSTERFPITGSFETYQDSTIQVHLNAGVNSITMFAVSDHGVSRVDQLTVTPATASVPSAPTNVVAKPGNGSATLSWTASTSGSPTSYTVYRGTVSDGEANAAVGTVSGTTTTFTDTGLHNGTTYFYYVAADNAVGVSPDGNEVSTTPAAAATAPSAPTGVVATPGNGSVSLTWTASAGATSYDVYRGTTAGGEGATPVGTGTTASFSDTGLTNGTTYYYKVTAVDSVGASPASGEVNATPSTAGAPPPGVPFGVVITPQAGHILLQWGKETGATGYRVYRSTTPGGEGATPLVTVTSPTYTDSGVVSGQIYYYQFTALNGTAESARTAEFSATAE